MLSPLDNQCSGPETFRQHEQQQLNNRIICLLLIRNLQFFFFSEMKAKKSMLSPLSPQSEWLNHCQHKHGQKRKSPLPKGSPKGHQALKLLQGQGFHGPTG